MHSLSQLVTESQELRVQLRPRGTTQLTQDAVNDLRESKKLQEIVKIIPLTKFGSFPFRFFLNLSSSKTNKVLDNNLLASLSSIFIIQAHLHSLELALTPDLNISRNKPWVNPKVASKPFYLQ